MIHSSAHAVRRATAAAILTLIVGGCSTMKPLETVDQVDIDRFMGDWYVIAHIPPFLTDEAYNAVERYKRGEGDKINVLYTYYDGGFDGELKTMTPTGFLGDDGDDAQWGMRLIWPFKADYRIAYLDDNYEETIIGRNKRDYVWIMAREPIISESRYDGLAARVANMGYELSKLRRVPQQPLGERTEPDVAKDF